MTMKNRFYYILWREKNEEIFSDIAINSNIAFNL